MCEFTSIDNKTKALKMLYHKNINLNLPDFKARFPKAFQFAKCPVCGTHLTNRQMKPSGRATRCMCVHDYKKLVADRINSGCIICHQPLPLDKIEEQVESRREIRAHMHEGSCVAVWTAIHNMVLGEFDVPAALGFPMSSLLQEKQWQPVRIGRTYRGKPVKLIT